MVRVGRWPFFDLLRSEKHPWETIRLPDGGFEVGEKSSHRGLQLSSLGIDGADIHTAATFHTGVNADKFFKGQGKGTSSPRLECFFGHQVDKHDSGNGKDMPKLLVIRNRSNKGCQEQSGNGPKGIVKGRPW